jgi:hypothetical protein
MVKVGERTLETLRSERYSRSLCLVLYGCSSYTTDRAEWLYIRDKFFYNKWRLLW